MTSPDDADGVVVSVDLRGLSIAEASTRARAVLDDPQSPDLTRMLVVDATGELLQHEQAYQILLASRRTDSLLCVAIGPLDRAGRTPIPASIGAGQGSCLLWAGDPVGIDWRLGATAARAHVATCPDAGIAELIDVLRTPEIHSRVLALAAAIPGGVASPGFRVTGSADDRTVVLAALTDAAHRVAGDEATGVDVSEDEATLLRLISRGDGRSTGILVPGGRLDQQHRRAADAVEDAIASVQELSGPLVAFRGAARAAATSDAVAAAGSELARLRAVADRVCGTWPQPGQVTPVAAELDLRVPHCDPLPGHARSRAVAALVERHLAQAHPLSVVEQHLQELQRRLAPDGPHRHRRKLLACAPPTLSEALTAQFPDPQPWLPVAMSVPTLMGGTGGRSSVIPTIGVLVLCMVLLVLAYVPAVRAGRRRAAGHLLRVLPTLLAAGAGTALGLFLSPDVPGLGIATPLIGAVAAVAVATISWRLRVARWGVVQLLQEARGAVEGIRQVITEMALDWSSAGERANLADALLRGRSQVCGVHTALAAVPVHPRPPAGTVRTGAWEYWGLVVGKGMADLVTEALRPGWDALEMLTPNQHEQTARRRCSEMLQAWQKHLNGGAPRRPPHVEPTAVTVPDRGQPRAEVAHSLVDYLADVIAEPIDGPMWQLVAPSDLPLLELSAARVTGVRFAPVALRDVAGPCLPPDVTWTATTLRAGTLRLVPVRPETVAPQWSVGDVTPTDPVEGWIR